MSNKSIQESDYKSRNTKNYKIIRELQNTINYLSAEKFIGVASPLPATVQDKSDNIYDF